MNQDQFLLDSGFWGWLYKLLYPVEWLMTQIMAGFHRFMVMLGMNEIGFSWVMSIVFLVIVVQACVFPLFYKSMKGMRKMQAQMAVLQPKMQRIQNKYKGKNDPASKEALQREMMKLYQDNDANPMGGCTIDAAYARVRVLCSCACSTPCRPFHTSPVASSGTVPASAPSTSPPPSSSPPPTCSA